MKKKSGNGGLFAGLPICDVSARNPKPRRVKALDLLALATLAKHADGVQRDTDADIARKHRNHDMGQYFRHHFGPNPHPENCFGGIE